MSTPLKIFVLLLIPLAGYANAPSWNLPKSLGDENVAVSFDLDTTWHMLHGQTKNITGQASLSNPRDPQSVQVEMKIPVNLFDTDNQSRDERLREVMSASDYPEVVIKTSRMESDCVPADVDKGADCTGKLFGELSIRNVKKSVLLPFTMKKEGDRYSVVGEVEFNWLDFGVEDPSIFIAKVAKKVTVKYSVRL